MPTPIQSELAATIKVLKGASFPASVSWVQSGNFHLTLSFLGDVEQTRVDELVPELRSACENIAPFELFCEELGYFPNVKRPRVIWAGARSERDDLSRLQRRVAIAVAPFAQRQEEKGRFHGHITLGRFRPNRGQPQNNLTREIEEQMNTRFGKWEVSEIELVRSDLSQGTPRYSVLRRIPLS